MEIECPEFLLQQTREDTSRISSLDCGVDPPVFVFVLSLRPHTSSLVYSYLVSTYYIVYKAAYFRNVCDITIVRFRDSDRPDSE